MVCFRYTVVNTVQEGVNKDKNNTGLKFVLNKEDLGTATEMLCLRVGTDRLDSSGQGSNPYEGDATSNLVK